MSYNLGTARGIVEILYNPKGIKNADKDLEGLGKRGEKSGQTLQKTGNVMGATGGVVAAGLLVAVNAAANFEKSLSGISAVSGATAEEMEQVRAKALQIGKDTAFGATDASEAMGELIKAGLTTREVLDGAADATVALAAAGEIALPEAATIASNAMNQFNLKAQDMPKVADLIAGAANASAIDVGEFGRSLSQVGTVANTVGFNFRDTAVAIALMGNAGIKGSDAGTSLKTMFINLVPHTEKAQSLFNELGLATFDTKRGLEVLREEGIKPTGTSMASVTKQLIDMSAQQSKSKVGSDKQRKAYAELVNSTGIMKNQFFDAKGKVKDLGTVFQTLQNALKNQTREQQIATLSTIFGTDAIRSAALATELGKTGFNEMAGAMQKVTAEAVAAERLDNVKGDIEKLKGSAETLAINLGTILLPSIRSLVQSFDSLVGKLNELDPATQKNIVTYSVWAAGILLAMAAVVKVVGIVGSFIGIITRAAAAMRLAAVANLLWNSSLVTTLRLQALYAAGWVRATAAAVANRVATLAAAASARVAAVAQAAWAAATSLLTLSNLRAAASIAVATAASVAQGIAAKAVAIATGIWTGVQTALNVVMSLNPFVLIVIAIIALIAIIVVAYKRSETFRNIVQAAFGAIRTIVVATMNIVRSIISAVWNFISGVFTRNMAIARAVISAGMNFIRSVWANGVAFWRAVISAVWNFITSRFQAGMALARGIISAGIAAVMAVFNRIRQIQAIVSGAFNAVVSAIRSKIGAAVSAVAGIVTGIMNRIAGLRNSLISVGADAIRGLLNGISSMAGAVMDKAREIANGVKNAIKSALSIKSPSRVTMDLGVSTGEGYLVGLEAMRKQILRTATSLAGIPIAAMTAPVGAFSGAPAALSPAVGTGGNTFGPSVQIDELNINAPAGTNANQVADFTVRRLSTAVATRTTGPRIRPEG